MVPHPFTPQAPASGSARSLFHSIRRTRSGHESRGPEVSIHCSLAPSKKVARTVPPWIRCMSLNEIRFLPARIDEGDSKARGTVCIIKRILARPDQLLAAHSRSQLLLVRCSDHPEHSSSLDIEQELCQFHHSVMTLPLCGVSFHKGSTLQETGR